MLLKGIGVQTQRKGQFQKCFGQWKDHWNKCVVSEGDYFERDKDCNTIH